MREDEFDFAGQNPGELFVVDEGAKPFDYEALLHQKGYTKNSSPDAGELFKALATKYVPTVIVTLPPRVVERVKIVRFPRVGVPGSLFALWFFLMCLALFVFGGILYPHMVLDEFEFKTHMQGGATCTINRTYIDSYSDGNGNTYFYLHVYFTLRTPNGKSYHTEDYWPTQFDTQADAQAYASEFRINNSYTCWYNSLNSTEATFFKRSIGFGDYVALFLGVCFFLLLIVLPVGLLVGVLCGAFLQRRQRQRA